MRRGQLYLVLEPGSVASKVRPCVIVQSDLALPALKFVTICPLTSTGRGLSMFRVPVPPDEANGLDRLSEVEVDLIDTVRITKLGPSIGHVAPGILRQVDEALRRWLDL